MHMVHPIHTHGIAYPVCHTRLSSVSHRPLMAYVLGSSRHPRPHAVGFAAIDGLFETKFVTSNRD